MLDISKFLKYFLLLTLLSINSSLLINENNYNGDDAIYIVGNNMSNITFDNKKTIFFIENKDNMTSFFSLLVIDRDNSSWVIDRSKEPYYKTTINGEDNQRIFSKSDNYNITVEIINILDLKDFKYFEIGKDDDDRDMKIKQKNFVRFIDKDDEKIKANINFKKEFTGNISYAIVRLASNDINYIPRVDSFLNEKIEKKECDKIIDVSIDINNPYKDSSEDFSKRGTLAFIVSLYSKSDDDIDEYIVIINREMMNVFLIVSIILAIIFAIITFFLIRRKPNPENKNNLNEDSNEEKQEEQTQN